MVVCPGQHVYLSAKVKGSLVVRAYTPVSSDENQGHVDLLVKVIITNTRSTSLTLQESVRLRSGSVSCL